MTLLVQHGFAGPSGEGDDHYVNTFHFRTPGVESLEALYAGFLTGTSGPTLGETIAAKFRGFYVGNASDSADNPVWYLSKAIGHEGEFFKIYDLDAAPHSPPVFSYIYPDVITGMATSSGSLPWEVALTMSFEAYSSGTLAGTGANSKARRRNRIYLGPFNEQAMAVITGGEIPRPHPLLVDAFIREYHFLRNSLYNDCGQQLVVYSKADSTDVDTTRVWIDNSWDTQRRRSAESSGRSTASWPPGDYTV
jgi:hypothetical protein